MTLPGRTASGGEFLVRESAPEDVFTPEDFTDEHRQLADTVSQFVANEVVPRVDRLEEHDFALLVSLLRRAGALGLLMIDIPEEFGGLELDKAAAMLAAEKVSRYGGFSVAFNAHTGIGTLPVVLYGTREQKAKYLPRLATGEWLAAYCLTEPDSGSDALGAKTTAVLAGDGSHYLLTGTKQFVTNGGFADLFTVFAKVDRERFTAFLVERRFPGVSVGPEENKMGIRGSSTTAVILDEARVPAENVLGEVGKGHKIAFNILNIGRFRLGASVVGAAKTAFAEGVRYANARRQFGVPIAAFGAVREKVADMLAAIYAAESLVYRLAGLLDRNLRSIGMERTDREERVRKGIEEYALECAAAKVFCSEVLGLVADEVVQIHGGYGYIREYPAERCYRDARINRIFEGTNEINRLLITGTLLKRAMKGEIALMGEIAGSGELLGRAPAPPAEPAAPLAAEQALAANLRTVFLAATGAAVRRHMDRLKDEQEILVALADLAIYVFALESAVLRAQRTVSGRGGRAEAVAAAKVFAWSAASASRAAAEKAAWCVGGEEARPLAEGIARFLRHDGTGLLEAKRSLAAAALEAERYIF